MNHSKIVLVVFIFALLAFQSIEARKKRKSTTSTTTGSTYLENVSEFFREAWDALLDLLASKSTTSTKKTKKKSKNKKKNQWNLDYYVKSATKNLNYVYKSVSDSMGMFQLGRSNKEQDQGLEGAFFAELLTAEVMENVTYGLVNIVSNIVEGGSE